MVSWEFNQETLVKGKGSCSWFSNESDLTIDKLNCTCINTIQNVCFAPLLCCYVLLHKQFSCLWWVNQNVVQLHYSFLLLIRFNSFSKMVCYWACWILGHILKVIRLLLGVVATTVNYYLFCFLPKFLLVTSPLSSWVVLHVCCSSLKLGQSNGKLAIAAKINMGQTANFHAVDRARGIKICYLYALWSRNIIARSCSLEGNRLQHVC